jgi:L-threonylcarbamoyladenylate synthase
VHLPAGTDLTAWAVAGNATGSTRLAGDTADRLEAARRLAAVFWPGPLTLVLPRAAQVLDEVTGGQATVALRVPANAAALELLHATGLALVGPSANRFGRISPTSAQHVLQELDGRIPFILDGGSCAVGVESTILDLSGSTARILRPGAISRNELEEALQLQVQARAGGDAPRVPGALASHYAPAARTLLLDAAAFAGFLAEAAAGSAATRPAGCSVISLQPAPPDFRGIWRQLPADAAGYARELYATLRELDDAAGTIVIEQPPDAAGWEAVNDRLRRAAA